MNVGMNVLQGKRIETTLSIHFTSVYRLLFPHTSLPTDSVEGVSAGVKPETRRRANRCPRFYSITEGSQVNSGLINAIERIAIPTPMGETLNFDFLVCLSEQDVCISKPV